MRRMLTVMILCVSSVARAQARGTVGAASADTSHVYHEFQVDRAVQRVGPSLEPIYPKALRSLHVTVEVQVQYIVDTLGFADVSTLKAIKSPDELFVTAFRDVLPKRRFHPALLQGRKVRQWVSERIFFTPPK